MFFNICVFYFCRMIQCWNTFYRRTSYERFVYQFNTTGFVSYWITYFFLSLYIKLYFFFFFLLSSEEQNLSSFCRFHKTTKCSVSFLFALFFIIDLGAEKMKFFFILSFSLRICYLQKCSNICLQLSQFLYVTIWTGKLHKTIPTLIILC